MYRINTCVPICLWATKKIFWPFCNKVSNSNAKSRHSRGYHQFRRNCISPTRSVVYHQAADRCTLKRDEIQPQRGWWYAPRFARWWYAKPAAWIKKFDKLKLVEFFGRDSRTRTYECQSQSLVPYRLGYIPKYNRYIISWKGGCVKGFYKKFQKEKGWNFRRNRQKSREE